MAEFRLWLEFEHWVQEPEDDPTDDFFNMKITLADGREYALNVWTFKYLERARREPLLEAHELHGRYLLAPDLFVERLDRGLIEEVVMDLIKTNQLRREWLLPCEGRHGKAKGAG